MEDKFEDYKKRFEEAWEAIPHPWQETVIQVDSVDDKVSHLSGFDAITPISHDIPEEVDIVVPIRPYGCVHKWEHRPHPIVLAYFAEELIRCLLTGDTGYIPYKPEGEPFKVDLFVNRLPYDEPLDIPDEHILIVRCPWGLDFNKEIFTLTDWIRFYGRFGVANLKVKV
jgi:hypothetical protein